MIKDAIRAVATIAYYEQDVVNDMTESDNQLYDVTPETEETEIKPESQSKCRITKESVLAAFKKEESRKKLKRIIIISTVSIAIIGTIVALICAIYSKIKKIKKFFKPFAKILKFFRFYK